MIYVLSDIHENGRRFRSVMEQIRLRPEDTLYILGDVVDRHPHGIRILLQIMSMPNAKMLLGNHEYMMLRALGFPYDDYIDDGGALDHWYRNGGGVTHAHWKFLRKSLRQQIAAYLLALPLQFDLTVAGKCYRLVHGAPAAQYDADPMYKNPTHFAVWKRLGVEDGPTDGSTLIFGHTPTEYYQEGSPMTLWQREGLLGIDCGSGYPAGSKGRLACLRLDDGKVFYSRM